jgi:hypothetical protein
MSKLARDAEVPSRGGEGGYYETAQDCGKLHETSNLYSSPNTVRVTKLGAVTGGKNTANGEI